MGETLSGILDERCVKLDLKARRKPDVLGELSEVLAAVHDIDDPSALAEELAEREKLSSTGIGNGIAIPHKLSGRVRQTGMAFARAPRGVKFDAVDRQPVRLFFLLVGPENTHTEHLKLLSRLSRYLHDPGFVRGLLEAATPQDVLDVFRQREAAG